PRPFRPPPPPPPWTCRFRRGPRSAVAGTAATAARPSATASPMSACSFFIVLSFLLVELAPAEERVGVEAMEHLDHFCLSLPVRSARHHVIEAAETRARDHVTTAAAPRRTRRRRDGDGEDDRRNHERGWY